MGTVGYEDVDCDFIDFTYVRICHIFLFLLCQVLNFLGFVMLVFGTIFV